MNGRRIIASYGNSSQVLTIDLKPGAREAKLPDSVQLAVDGPRRLARTFGRICAEDELKIGSASSLRLIYYRRVTLVSATAANDMRAGAC